MKYEHDRGAFHELRFQRCERGFLLSSYDMQRDARPAFAFDRIEDLAAWLVEQYAQGTEAQRAETGTGSVHDGPVAESDAPKPRNPTGKQTHD